MKNNNEERLEELEEVVQTVITKMQELETRKIEVPEIHIPDYTSQLETIKNELVRVNHTYPVGKIQQQIAILEELIGGIPEIIQIRHHHHFQDKSKGLFIGAIILVLVSAISVGVAVSMWNDNGRMNENSVKFRMIRQQYANVAYWADTAYHHYPDAMELLTERLEAEQLATAQAEAAAKEKVKDAEERKEKLNQLQKKLKSK